MTSYSYLRIVPLLGLGIVLSLPPIGHAAEKNQPKASVKSDSIPKKKKKTHRPQHGKASYYGKEFYGRKMADGTKMDPQSNIAASRTLPLGTTAEVTNLENGKSEVVEIRDRGPYIDGRIIDLTPKTAQELGFKEEGVAPVVVQPLEFPKSGEETKP